MITPRRTRLLRVPNEQAFRRAVRLLIVGGDSAARLIIVPTCGAAVQLRRVLESGERPDSGLSASLVTRDQLYAQLHRRLPLAPRVLTGFERDAMAQAAAAAAMAVDLPFQIPQVWWSRSFVSTTTCAASLSR